MKCPNCGIEVGESPFCNNCGADLTGNIRRHRIFIRNLDRRVRHGAAAGITLVAVFSVLIVLITAVPTPTDAPGTEWPPEDYIDVGNGSIIVPYEGFHDSFQASFNSSKGLVISLDSKLAEGYDTFVWEFRNNWQTSSWVITKTSPELTWMAPEIGDWTVSVFCSGSEKKDTAYTGSLTYLGDETSIHMWMHNGKTLSISLKVSLDSFIDARGSGQDRYMDDPAYAIGMISSTGMVAALEEKIWNAFKTSFAFDRASSNYASCLLSMVDQCFEVRPDQAIHGKDTYWMTPVETLYMGVGDTADMSILAASLLRAAGFDVVLVNMPDEWMVGIASLRAADEAGAGYVILDRNQGYHLAMVDGFHGIGVVNEKYGLVNGQYIQSGTVLSYPYGILTYRA